MIDEPAENPEYPRFGGVYVAVFNSTEYDRTVGRRDVLDKFGEAGWDKVKKRMKSGCMEIFQHPPIPETELFVFSVGQQVERRHKRRSARRKSLGVL